MALTTHQLKKLIANPGRHSDGKGLYFRTIGEGRAYWCYRYRIGGKEREISIGPFPEVSLEQARAEHVKLRNRVVNDRGDPLADKQAGRIPGAAAPSFAAIADAHIKSKTSEWKSAKHHIAWTMTLTEYCKPIRNMPVDQIATKDVLAVLTPLWTKTPETASRLRARIETVLNHARALGHIDEDKANPARWKGHLDHLLPNPHKTGKPRGHHPAMPYADLPAFMAKLRPAPSEGARALMFLILTAARSEEVRGAVWDEIDLEQGVWTVPAERMKSGREHRVPLSEPAVALLREQFGRRQENQHHVFLGQRAASPQGVVALAQALHRAGAGQFTVHGFRSAFRDWAGDETSSPREVAEAALAHAVGDAAELAYRRGDALKKRRALMEAWAGFLNQGADTNVIPISRGVASQA
jgi:integrase